MIISNVKILTIAILVLVALNFLSIFLLALCVFYVKNNIMFGSLSEKPTYTYQLAQINQKMNESFFGFVRTLDRIEGNEIYVYDTGNVHLISQFGTDEYECSGSCFCEKSSSSDFRRGVDGVVVRGLKCFVASVSSVIAYNLARDHFKEECNSRYENVCGSESIRTEVEDCIMLKKKVGRKQRTKGRKKAFEKTTMTSETPTSFARKEKRRYLCKGNCMINNEFVRYAKENDEFKVWRGKVKLVDTLKMSIFGVKGLKNCHEMELVKNVLSTNLQGTYMKFINSDLTQYCMLNSIKEFNRKDGTVLRTSVCTAFDEDDSISRKKRISSFLKSRGSPIKNNKSVVCTLVVGRSE